MIFFFGIIAFTLLGIFIGTPCTVALDGDKHARSFPRKQNTAASIEQSLFAAYFNCFIRWGHRVAAVPPFFDFVISILHLLGQGRNRKECLNVLQ